MNHLYIRQTCGAVKDICISLEQLNSGLVKNNNASNSCCNERQLVFTDNEVIIFIIIEMKVYFLFVMFHSEPKPKNCKICYQCDYILFHQCYQK